MRAGDVTTQVRCTYCKTWCDGSKRDTYGELKLGGPLPVCAACDDDLQHEDGPWNGW